MAEEGQSPRGSNDSQEIWRITEKLRELDLKMGRADTKFDTIMQALNGVGQEPGIRQQLRELKHYIEGNPPAVRGIMKDLEAIHQSYTEMSVRVNAKHDALREDFDDFVRDYIKDKAKREGTEGGSKTVWALLGSIAIIVLMAIGLIMQAYSAAVNRGGA
jgi:hypothetical protein